MLTNEEEQLWSIDYEEKEKNSFRLDSVD